METNQSGLLDQVRNETNQGPTQEKRIGITVRSQSHFSRGRGRGRTNRFRNELRADGSNKKQSTNQCDSTPGTSQSNDDQIESNRSQLKTHDTINEEEENLKPADRQCTDRTRERGRRGRQSYSHQRPVGRSRFNGRAQSNSFQELEYPSTSATEIGNDPRPSNAFRGPYSVRTGIKSANSSYTAPRRFIRDRNAAYNPRTDKLESSRARQNEMSEIDLKNNTFECMICCDDVRRAEPIWYCSNCFNIFHMRCAIEWCNKSIKSRDEAIANSQFPSLADSATSGTSSRISQALSSSAYPDYRQERQKSVEWPCPACRTILHSRPGKYKCFCGKVIRPEVYRHQTPHSCGQICGRERPSVDCPHTCESICHPGRCSPCHLVTTKSCFCGKLQEEKECSSKVGSCNQICGKSLKCGRHSCNRLCHDGNCAPCDEIITIECHCGSKTIARRCGDHKRSDKSTEKEEKISCDKICDRLLDCKQHRCQQRCHPGPECPSCPLLSKNLKTCPCGSKPISESVLAARKACIDPLPTCESKCNRLLICGPDKNRHRCQKKCHIGSCPPCKLKTSVKCECSVSTKTMECSLLFEKILDENQKLVGFKQVKYSFRCESRCNIPKNCGRHRCQEKCCTALGNMSSRAHICTQICNRKLPCGTHTCQEMCHAGLCGDCTNIGWAELTCHCGASIMYPPIPCGAKPPACRKPCRRAHVCGHTVRHECHDDTETCAPCTMFVKKSCFCGAESKESVHCYLSGYSCGRTCKKQLSCRMHTCERICHDGECETPNKRGVIVCSQPCQKPRFVCKHPCNVPCHGKTPCPSTICTKAIEVTCECGNKNERVECHGVTRDSDNRNRLAMLSMNRPNQDSVVVDLSNNTKSSSSAERGPVSQSSGVGGLKKLDCDESCAIYKRNKALAEALNIAQPDLKPTTMSGEDTLKLLREATAHDYKFVAATFNSLAKLVKSVKESERRFIFLQFPPADTLRREVIHELAYHFNCTSESRNDEPERFVVVRANRSKSSVPEFTIEQLLPIDD